MADFTNIDQIYFDMLVKMVYANNSGGKNLKMTTQYIGGIRDKVVHFRKMGSVQMGLSSYLQQVSFSDPNYQKVALTPQKYNVAIPIGDVEQYTVNFNEQAQDAKALALATQRYEDQLVINALNVSGTTNVIVDGGTNLTYAKLLQVIKYFDEIGVPQNDRIFAMSAAGQQSLMNEEKFTSSLYIDYKIIPRGGLDGVKTATMNFVVIPTMREGGLPLSGNIRSCFAWQRDSIGYVAREFSTLVERRSDFDGWQALARIFAASGAIDADGIVQIDIDETK